ncbi:alpha/beta hydrolase [Faecalibacter bovis]|uniref:Alpha/beta hydrolase n=1 Tax=Faecalibacter bovis TaxID=2898187 RepID=A0ABX7XBX9_9FLAO|nr:alpha/beta hydrolase-fold protein [Faecalibacter bovis]QTV05319.1 alpha/beta hydrolase [Faecalibacter bovis]
MVKIIQNIIFFLFVANSHVIAQDVIPRHETIELFSKILNENRKINIWTPNDYSTSNKTYTVLYMLDGGIKEDFPHLAYTIAELVKKDKIIPIILVGIENTERRRDFTSFTTVKKDKKIAPNFGGSTNFRSFLSDELIPEINKLYKTNNRKGIIGESVAGLFVIESLVEKPELFDDYIAFDPSLWWNNQYLVKHSSTNIKIPRDKEIRLWFAGSNAADIAPYTQKLAQNFLNQPVSNLIWNYSDEPKEKHHTIFKATKEKALIWTYRK